MCCGNWGFGVVMSDFDGQVPPPSPPPQPPPGKPPNPLVPVEQTRISVESAKAKIRCRFCGRVFSDGPQLELHIKETHKGAEKNPK